MQKLVKEDTTPAPGGGESFKRFRTRYLSYLEKLMQMAISEGKTVFVVCHFRNLITYDGWKEQGYPSDFSVDTTTVLGDKFKTGEIYEIDLEDYLKKRGSNG
jgi:broad specificity phosphatase PhoE